MQSAGETKFTPGPWRCHLNTIGPMGPYNLGVDVGPPGRATARVIGEFESSQLGDEAIANAHLIAAAPELYAAMTALLKAYAVDEAVNEWPEEWRNCVAVLSKARGES